MQEASSFVVSACHASSVFVALYDAPVSVGVSAASMLQIHEVT